MKVRSARGSRSQGLALVLLLVAIIASSCGDSSGPTAPVDDNLFARYVALGNSITASFQSGGIHQEMQEQAYPVLLAKRAGATFGIPALAFPGCPPPLAGPLTAERIAEGICAGRVQPRPVLVQNLAVPGATVAHALSPVGTGSGLDFLILGAQSQVDAMRAAQPTLVSVWLGNNDALRAALQADTTLLTPLPDFRAAYDLLVEAIRSTRARDVILIGTADAAIMAPALQPGTYFWGLAQLPDLPVALDVDDDCAPFASGGDRNEGAFRHVVSFQAVADHLASGAEGAASIRCGPGDPYVLDEAAQQSIARRVADFNAHIRQRADDNGWIYVDPMDMFLPAHENPDLIRKCQGLAGAATPEQFEAAVQNTCPGPTAPNFFGLYFSYDGVHPSSEAHAVIADVLAGRLDQKHGLNLAIDS
jgi:lysophospholipase L1-like esterase